MDLRQNQRKKLDGSGTTKVEVVEHIADLAETCIALGRDGGHHNEKQKIHRFLSMELANIRLRKSNLQLRDD